MWRIDLQDDHESCHPVGLKSSCGSSGGRILRHCGQNTQLNRVTQCRARVCVMSAEARQRDIRVPVLNDPAAWLNDQVLEPVWTEVVCGVGPTRADPLSHKKYGI
jgi:hypothetical protein